MAGALALLVAVALPACGGGSSKTEIAGAGSTAQEAVQADWIERFEIEEPDAKVTYEPVGSAAGRRAFIAGDAAYAASDTPLEGAELRRAAERCEPGQLVEVPAYVSRIVVAFNLAGARLINLSPRTLAKIFDQEITRWSAPAIRRENPSLPRLRGAIARVYPAGESGVTANFTEYLSEAAPGVWRYEPSEKWPTPEGGVPFDDTAGMFKALRSREGTIAFLDASQGGRLKLVLLKTGDRARDVAVPSRGSSIAALESSPEAEDLKRGPYMHPVELERPVATRSAYPIVFTSYLIACTEYDSAAEAAAVRGFLEFVVGDEGQEVVATGVGVDLLEGAPQKRAEAAVAAIE